MLSRQNSPLVCLYAHRIKWYRILETLRTGEESARVGHVDAGATSNKKEFMEMQRAMTESLKTQTAMANLLIEKIGQDALIII